MHSTPGPLPPLNAVRAFEAAARLGSFTRAAQELSMTQAAISYQIKQLEQRLGVMLFQRLPRKIVLTRDGERLAPAILDAFSGLRTAFAQALSRAHNELAITSLPTIASNWLVPRLGGFHLAHAEVAVRLDTSITLADLQQGEFDVAIRSGRGDWPGHTAHFLLPSLITPLMSPRLRDAAGGLKSPADLLKLARIGRPRWWQQWFEENGVDVAETALRASLDLGIEQYEITAAIAGQGVAISSPLFFRAELESGQLVQPFAHVARDSKDYWLVYATTRAKSHAITAFRTWLLREARAEVPAD
ncbi:MAG: LysR family transcriptional regulator [Rudaea sp.]|uniref:LysR substrate-binding domain-containing protein n=1 Tax=unclassified Rudaea TaxID=2627037 RepID=UPI0010F8C935|nr:MULTISPECIES: LysR substrate-binding domain-containing protein [unclassified Rudaea]MBN8884904.1 LysR family transcriptional regulator [Rudaea sp.]